MSADTSLIPAIITERQCVGIRVGEPSVAKPGTSNRKPPVIVMFVAACDIHPVRIRRCSTPHRLGWLVCPDVAVAD
jgi:hypothetical protein